VLLFVSGAAVEDDVQGVLGMLSVISWALVAVLLVTAVATLGSATTAPASRR